MSEDNNITKAPTMTKQEAIDELREEARQLDQESCSIKQYASNAYKAKIRRKLADKLESELQQEQENKN